MLHSKRSRCAVVCYFTFFSPVLNRNLQSAVSLGAGNREQPNANGMRACVQECTVCSDVNGHQQVCVCVLCKACARVWPTVHSSMSKKDKTKQKKNTRNTPSCSTTHLPVLEGRNQPALKIDMRRERSRAAAEGEHAGRGGRWQLVAWISASQTGPMAIPHTPCSV